MAFAVFHVLQPLGGVLFHGTCCLHCAGSVLDGRGRCQDLEWEETRKRQEEEKRRIEAQKRKLKEEEEKRKAGWDCLIHVLLGPMWDGLNG